MPAQQGRFSGQQGSTLLMALMVLLILSVLGMGIVEVADLEFKTSQYDYETQQAQQALDAGVDWGIENIYQELVKEQYSKMENLPDKLPWGSKEMSFTAGSGICHVTIENVVKKAQSSQQVGINTCTYEFTSSGSFKRAGKSVTVQVEYTFMGGYSYCDSEGIPRFMPRSDFNRGKVRSYKTI